MIKNFYTDINAKNVLVKLTGESDSAILYYMVCEYYKNTHTKIFPYVHVNENKKYKLKYFHKVIDKVTELTGKSPTRTYFYSSNNEEEQDKLLKILISRDIEIFYTGLTNDIPNYKLKFWLLRNHKKLNLDIETSFFHLNKRVYKLKDKIKIKINKMKDRLFKFNLLVHNINKKLGYVGFLLNFPKARSKSDQNLLSPHDGCLIYYPYIENKKSPLYTNKPFAEHDLRYISKLYKKYELVDKLLPITFDCADVKELHNDAELYHCGYCTKCTERWYTFNRLK